VLTERIQNFSKIKGIKVIVGIIDSGVDIEHEDLKSVIWTNSKEIAGNGIDDDNNGYVDDIHGWNFLGDITKENLEYERIIKDKTLVDEVTYKEAKKINDDKVAQAKAGSSRLEQLLTLTGNADAVIEKHLRSLCTIDEVNAIDSKEFYS
jgi:subtilisin family serine protease